MWPTALLSLRRKSCYGFLSPFKVHHPRHGLNPRTLGRMASTVSTRPPRTTRLYSKNDTNILYVVLWGSFLSSPLLPADFRSKLIALIKSPSSHHTLPSPFPPLIAIHSCLLGPHCCTQVSGSTTHHVRWVFCFFFFFGFVLKLFIYWNLSL
jgi:hypothetical protein